MVVEGLLKTVQGFPQRGKVMIAGDYNIDPSRLLDTSYTSRTRRIGQKLLSGMEEQGFERLSFGKTFHRTVLGREVSSELDWALARGTEVEEIFKVENGISDHDLIGWKLRMSRKEDRQEQKIQLRNYHRINMESFRNDLAGQPWEILTNLPLEEMAKSFNAMLLEVLDVHAPLRDVTNRKKKAPRPSFELKRIRRLRDNARSKGWKEKTRLLRKQCIKVAKKESLAFLKERLEKGSGEVWKIVKEITGKGGGKISVIKDESKPLDNQEAANAFNSFFISKIEKIQAGIEKYSGDPLWGAKKKAKSLEIKPGEFRLIGVSEEEVRNAIRRSKNSKCADNFGIAPAALKIAPDIISVPLSWIINEVIRQGQVPAVWKQARVLPLHKKKEKSKVENYRPVSILPSPSKIMEEVIRKHLSKYMETKKILPDSQYGFRAGRSTILATGAATHDWAKARKSGKHCGALFFDLSAAFDCIDVTLLAAKLKIYGASGDFIKWVTSYMSGRSQRVEYGGQLSEEVNVTVGSPQGSVISPLLFLILTADLEEWVSQGRTVTYADDTTCYVEAKTREEVREGLRKSATEVLSFMKASKLAANASKTKFVFFSRRREDPLRVGEVEVEESCGEELLGLTVCKSLSWKMHIDKVEVELRKRVGILRRLAWKLPRSITTRMIEPMFTSKLRYGLELVTNACDPQDVATRRLQALHRSALRVALKIKKKGVPYKELLLCANQKSVEVMSKQATSLLAWKCAQNWQNHPLTAYRLECHKSLKPTRQSVRQFPPQSLAPCESIISRIVEIWESMPENLKSEKKLGAVKKLIEVWCNT